MTRYVDCGTEPSATGHNRAGVEAVVFDWGGTLTPWCNVDVFGGWLAVARLVSESEAERLAQQLHDVEEALWRRTREKGVSATFHDVLTTCGIAPSDDLLLAHCSHWSSHSLSDPAAVGVLSALRRRGLKIGLLSNTIWPRPQHEAWLQRDGLLELIDAAVYSSEIKWAKPHAHAFESVLAALDHPPAARTIFVGDRLYEDIYGATQVGMRTILVPHSRLPQAQLGPQRALPTAVISSLDEIVALVDSWI